MHSHGTPRSVRHTEHPSLGARGTHAHTTACTTTHKPQHRSENRNHVRRSPFLFCGLIYSAISHTTINGEKSQATHIRQTARVASLRNSNKSQQKENHLIFKKKKKKNRQRRGTGTSPKTACGRAAERSAERCLAPPAVRDAKPNQGVLPLPTHETAKFRADSSAAAPA